MKETLLWWIVSALLVGHSLAFLASGPSNICSVLCATQQQQEEEDGWDNVSDEEAVLAIRAYLQRHRRLGEIKISAKRKKMAKRLARKNLDRIRNDMDIEKNPEYDFRSPVEDNEHEKHRAYIELLDPNTEVMNEETKEVTFTGYPAGPDPSFVTRSEARKAVWAKPGFKENLKISRYGTTDKKAIDKIKRQRKVARMVRTEVPSNLLRAVQAVDLSPQEIKKAIRDYTTCCSKRSKSRLAYLKRKKQEEEGLESMETIDAEDLDEHWEGIAKNSKEDVVFDYRKNWEKEWKKGRKKRSQDSKFRYQRRLQNEERRLVQERKKKKMGRKARPISPKHAMGRIQQDLKDERLPMVEDVECALIPGSLTGRKNAFRRILSEYYNLRGKCVPPVVTLLVDKQRSYNDDELLFATQCSVHLLGRFVVYVMKTRKPITPKRMSLYE